MTSTNAIILGLIQGLTEFLPVSSSGHLVITEHLLDQWRQPGVTFEVILHIATLLAVIIFFRHDLKKLICGLGKSGNEGIRQRHLLGLLIAGSVPTGIIGVMGKKFFVEAFNRLDLVGAMLLITAVLLFLANRRAPRESDATSPGYAVALLIGLVQGLAILPGISRSGSTIAVGMLAGLKGESAARFSFLLSLPAISGAALLNCREIAAIAPAEIPVYALGFVTALLTGLASLKMLLMIIEQRRLGVFACYCVIVGSLTLGLSLLG